MFEPWALWDERLLRTGRPSRLAQEMTSAELLTLLAAEGSGAREAEKRIVKDELLARLESRSRHAQGPLVARSPGALPLQPGLDAFEGQ